MDNRRVLFIASSFFNYAELIKSELINQGWQVDYYDDRPSTNAVIKGMIKVNKQLMDGLIQAYFDKIMSETKNKNYDLVFVINCKVFSPSMVERLKRVHRNAKFVLYLWDSIANYPHTEALISCFDKAFSFDSEDCRKHDKMIFLPLFYSDNYRKLSDEARTNDYQYDISIICTAHPKRYEFLKKLIPFFKTNHMKYYMYMYLGSRLLFLYNKMFQKEFKHAKLREFEFTPLGESQVLDVVKKSKIILDIQHHLQTGLTMRTIETLGAKRKLITTNENIKNYDFYHPNNIFLMDESNYESVKEFMKLDYVEIKKEIYAKYSLVNWVKQITAGS
ncbi:MAG TPA: hypothetical protein VEC37_12655 [Bacillota bacterium]|nr:hypothetical protein [Bacillota bacterium]